MIKQSQTSWSREKLGIKNVLTWLAAFAIVLISIANAAIAEELPMEHRLPVKLANEAANAAIMDCEKAGIAISVTIVDQHGQAILQIKGDKAAPHTMGLSEQKAYTAITLAAIQGVSTTSEMAENLRSAKKPIGELAIPSSPIPGIIGLPGGVIIKTSNNEIIGGIGVSGAKNGATDEQCAIVGIKEIGTKLEVT